MKKVLIVLFVCITAFNVKAQDPQLFEETWYLNYINTDYPETLSPIINFFTLSFSESNGDYTFSTNGVTNDFTGTIVFSDTEDEFELQNIAITDLACDDFGCDFENEYFYEVLTSIDLDLKVFSYDLTILNDGSKTLRIVDQNYNTAFYKNTPFTDFDENFFQTWYLHKVEGDLGPSNPITSPTPPQITINPDFTFQGTNGCVTFNGVFAYGEDFEWYDYALQVKALSIDDSNCENGEPNSTGIPELQDTNLLLGVYDISNTYFSIESYPGFISYFRNFLLDTPVQSLTDLFISPNPVSETLQISSKEIQLSSIEILSLQGKVLTTEIDNFQEINLSHLSSGVYFIKLLSEENSVIKKFIKK